ncbi:MAG: ferritin-like domain-containing protein, partial [Acidimicrobiaceae bacterium]
EASIRMRDRFLQQEVWHHMGVDPKTLIPLLVNDPTRKVFQQMLFAKIVPNCKKLGLLDRNDKWLRHRFEEMGVIQFEDWENTDDEYLKFEIGKDVEIRH